MTCKIYEFRVREHGFFPCDMLRYDRAWPASTDDAHHLSGVAQRDIPVGHVYEVVLYAIQPPTTARWESFGWKVLNERIVQK